MTDDFKAEFLPAVKGETLDDFLLKGWYRMGMLIFTTNHLPVKENSYPVYWLRYSVKNIVHNKTNQKLIKKNSIFSSVCRPFSLTAELAALHTLYFNHIDFITEDNLWEIMYDLDREIFDSYVIEVRFGEQLVAAGIFDRGDNSIAGIKSFYHPDFKKYSLGKYLMLLKLDYCLAEGIKWYYPGYFSPSYPKFNYKLFMDRAATEVLIPQELRWLPYQQFLSDYEEVIIPIEK